MANDKVLSIRADDETISRLNTIAEQSGMKKNELLTALLETYEAERLRNAIPEHAADLDNLRSMLKKIENAFVASYDFAANSEERARMEFEKQLDIYEQTIAELKDKQQASEEQLAERADAVKALQEEHHQLSDALAQERKLTKTQTETIEGLRAAKESMEHRVLALESKLKDMPDMDKKLKAAQAQINDLKEQITKAEQEFKKKIWQERQIHIDNMDNLRNKFNSKLDENADRYNAMQKQLTDALDEARHKLNEADDAARAKVDAALSKADERHEREMSRLLARLDRIDKEQEKDDSANKRLPKNREPKQ